MAVGSCHTPCFRLPDLGLRCFVVVPLLVQASFGDPVLGLGSRSHKVGGPIHAGTV